MNGQLETGNEIQTNAEAYWADALSLFQKGQMHDTISSCQKLLELEPNHADAVQLIGKAAKQLGQLAHAEKFFRAALEMRPDSIDALNELGAVLIPLGQTEQSLEYFMRALELHPDSPQANFNVSTLLYDMERLEEALRYCLAAIALREGLTPQVSLAAYIRAALISFRLDDLHRSLEFLDEASKLDSEDVNVLYLLAMNNIGLGRPDAALPYLERVLSRFPDDEFANARKRDAQYFMQDSSSAREELYNSGLVDQAEQMARDDLARDDSVENHNFLLKCYLVNGRHSALDYLQVCREWARTHEHEEALPDPAEFPNNRDPNRRLRIGIVGDYFLSVIGAYTLLPWFRQYDRTGIELYCYDFGSGEEGLRPLVDHYRDISLLSGQEFFQRIRDDVIDIMLDINGRLRTPNHFETLLRQPAPIQVNWYNLPCTVGVKAYNYAISDDYCIREGEEEGYVERVFRMPTGTICAWDMGEPPEVRPPPCLRKGYVTFGCFGDFFKVNEGVLEAWAKLLGRVPGSRLYLKSNNLRLQAERERVVGFFGERGISRDRLILEGMSSFVGMKKCYEWVDIAVDTFPYSSGSTTINALWQGVPVVAIEGDHWRGRSTAAVLAGAGLERFVAADVEGYIAKAAALAADPDQLAELRATLGRHMAASPQWDVKTFARNFEVTLRRIWQDWLRES